MYGKACPYFPLGRCEKGDGCKWAHVGDQQAASAERRTAPRTQRLPVRPPRAPFLAAGLQGPMLVQVSVPTAAAQKVCPFFGRGKCEKGQACKWLHALALPPGLGGLSLPGGALGVGGLLPGPAGARDAGGFAVRGDGQLLPKVCPFFPVGKCEKGAACRWMHQSPASVLAPVETLPVSPKVCPYFAQGRCEKGQQCKWVHAGAGLLGVRGQPQVPLGTAKVCPYFELGKCEKGATCKWLHASREESTPSAASTTKVCPYFELGKCEKGGKCKWLHASHEGSTLSAASMTKVCPYFEIGKCEKGSKCKWLHASPEESLPGPGKVCPYFPLGRCEKGAGCKWQHIMDEDVKD